MLSISFALLQYLRESKDGTLLIFHVNDCHFHFSESERAERERKGDLDQYERMDGDRNQTSEFLAVKKVDLI